MSLLDMPVGATTVVYYRGEYVTIMRLVDSSEGGPRWIDTRGRYLFGSELGLSDE